MWAPHLYVSLFPYVTLRCVSTKFLKPLLGLQAYHCTYLWSGGLKEGHREVPNPNWKMTSTKIERNEYRKKLETDLPGGKNATRRLIEKEKQIH